MSSNLYLIPPVVYSINTTDCLCSSMEDLADAIHSPIEHDCAATPTCDGVTCQLDVLGNAYIVEMDVLSCAQPPGVDVLVIDSMGQIFYSTVVNDNTTGVILIGSYYVLMMATLIRHDYSIEVEVCSLTCARNNIHTLYQRFPQRRVRVRCAPLYRRVYYYCPPEHV